MEEEGKSREVAEALQFHLCFHQHVASDMGTLYLPKRPV